MEQWNAKVTKIVIGLDGSRGSAHALNWTIRIARSAGAEVVAVYATPYAVELPETHVRSDEEPAMRRDFEDKWCEPLRKAGIRYRTVIADIGAVEALTETAELETADMIVVGSRGLGGVRAVVVGSVSHALVEHAAVPTAVVPPPDRERVAPPSNGAGRKIVLGLDGSEGSIHALYWAIRVARAVDAEVVAVFAKPFTPYAVEIPEANERPESDQRLQKEFEESWCEPLRRNGTRYRTIFADTGPAQALMDTALHEDADMIVVGSRGLGGFRALLLGSVSRQLVEHAAVPVVVVPPYERERAAEPTGAFRRATQPQPAG